MGQASARKIHRFRYEVLTGNCALQHPQYVSLARDYDCLVIKMASVTVKHCRPVELLHFVHGLLISRTLYQLFDADRIVLHVDPVDTSSPSFHGEPCVR